MGSCTASFKGGLQADVSTWLVTRKKNARSQGGSAQAGLTQGHQLLLCSTHTRTHSHHPTHTDMFTRHGDIEAHAQRHSLTASTHSLAHTFHTDKHKKKLTNTRTHTHTPRPASRARDTAAMAPGTCPPPFPPPPPPRGHGGGTARPCARPAPPPARGPRGPRRIRHHPPSPDAPRPGRGAHLTRPAFGPRKGAFRRPARWGTPQQCAGSVRRVRSSVVSAMRDRGGG